jgi:DNA mismatch repair ATPase MutS
MTNESACMNDDIWPDTHMFRDYLRLKAEVPSALLLLEMGAFLEAWGADAAFAAPVLDIALTHRGTFRDGAPIPMCGIPADSRFASAEGSDVQFIGSTTPYIKALVRAGFVVAIAVCQPTMPVTRKIEWTVWPDGKWPQGAANRWINWL